MCAVCDARQGKGKTTTHTQLTRSVFSSIKPEEAAAEGVKKFAPEGASADAKEAIGEMYAHAFGLGAIHAIEQIAPDFDRILTATGHFIRATGEIAKKYASTPSVMADLEDMITIMQHHVQHDLAAYEANLLADAMRSGVRRSLVVGEEKAEQLLDEELALIGEQATKSTEHAASALGVGGIIAMFRSSEANKIKMGRGMIELHVRRYTKFKEASTSYMLGDGQKFADLLRETGYV